MGTIVDNIGYRPERTIENGALLSPSNPKSRKSSQNVVFFLIYEGDDEQGSEALAHFLEHKGCEIEKLAVMCEFSIHLGLFSDNGQGTWWLSSADSRYLANLNIPVAFDFYS